MAIRTFTKTGSEISPLTKPECQALLQEMSMCTATEKDKQWHLKYANYFELCGYLTLKQVEVCRRIIHQGGGDCFPVQLAFSALPPAPVKRKTRPKGMRYNSYWSTERVVSEIKNAGVTTKREVRELDKNLYNAMCRVKYKDPGLKSAVKRAFASNLKKRNALPVSGVGDTCVIIPPTQDIAEQFAPAPVASELPWFRILFNRLFSRAVFTSVAGLLCAWLLITGWV